MGFKFFDPSIPLLGPIYHRSPSQTVPTPISANNEPIIMILGLFQRI